MNAWTQFRLKNAMLVATLSANLLSGMAMDVLILVGDVPPPPDVIRLAFYLDLTFIPMVFVLSAGFILWYERPIRSALERLAEDRSLSGRLGRKARRRLLNEPYMLLMVSWSLWLYGTVLYSGVFWLAGAGPLDIYRAVFRSISTGLITVVAAYFLLENILQRWLAPVFFPQGGLSKTPRVLRIRLSVRLTALLLACNVVPLLTITGAVMHVTAAAPDQATLADMIRSAVVYDAALFMAIGIFLTVIVSRNLSRSMDDIIRVLKRIRRQDLDQKVRVVSSDEIGYAGDVINEMTAGLKERDALRQSLALAQEVQQQLLPSADLLVFDGLQIAGRSVYCDQTGGDYVDVFPIDLEGRQRLAMAVGDVSGHGIPSALLMATVRGALRQRALLPGTPAEIISDVNRQLTHDVEESGQFMTLFFAVFDPEDKQLQWVRAGHDPALLYDPRRDAFDSLRGEGVALGLADDWRYRTYGKSGCDGGHILLIGTDGIWEARNPRDEMFGKTSLQPLIRRWAQHDARRIRDAILDDLDHFLAASRPADDVTLIVAKVQ